VPPPGQPPPGQPPYGYPPYGSPPPGQPPYGYPPAYGYAPPPYGYPHPRSTNGFAIASLVCAFLCTPLGIVFGVIALSQIKSRGEDGRGLALAGLIVSSVILAVVVVGFVAALAVSPSTTYN
jgi:peptidyl-prolyl cis-trans isomerase B (cyclophilin B)